MFEGVFVARSRWVHGIGREGMLCEEVLMEEVVNMGRVRSFRMKMSG